MATPQKRSSKDITFQWEGLSSDKKVAHGEIRAVSFAAAQVLLKRQGIVNAKIKKAKTGGKVTSKDITLFTRQLATMMKTGIPLLQSFDIVGRGHANPAVGKLIMDIKADIETGTSMSNAFRKYPLYFDDLYCNLVGAGEAAGILETLLDRLASYQEKMQSIKSKIKSALTYPIAIIVVAFTVTAAIMIFVIPSFKEVFSNFNAELPLPTQIVINISDFVMAWWYLIFGGIGGGLYFFFYTWKRSKALQYTMDKFLLRAPIFGEIVKKSVIARWTKTLATMFTAGVPLAEALDSVGGACGNQVYQIATKKIQNEVISGTGLAAAMVNANIFPNMVTQMVSIGEESGALDSMLGKVADFFEAEVDDAVAAISSLMEPVIMVVLGVLIGGLVVAMYLPIFKFGGAV